MVLLGKGTCIHPAALTVGQAPLKRVHPLRQAGSCREALGLLKGTRNNGQGLGAGPKQWTGVGCWSETMDEAETAAQDNGTSTAAGPKQWITRMSWNTTFIFVGEQI